MSRWILLRHGESVANRERWLAGSTDTPLTDQGRDQARAAGVVLKNTGLDRVLCSSLSRAVETARLVLAGRVVPLSFHDALQERALGRWAVRGIDEVRREAGERLWSWDEPAPDGESCGQVALRVLDFLRGVPAIPGTTLVVCHGGVIRSLLGLVDDTPYGVIGQRKVPNAQPNSLDLDHTGWTGIWERHALELELFQT